MIAINKLKDYLSSEKRKIVFISYMFEPISPSEVAKKTNIPLSTVDRITSMLQISGFLEKVEESNGKNYYFINYQYWIIETLKFLKLSIDDEEEIKNIELILKNPYFFVFNHITNSKPDFLIKIYEKMFEMNIVENPKFLAIFQFMIRSYNVADYPLIIFLRASPFADVFSNLFKKIDFTKMPEPIAMLNEELEKDDFLKNIIEKFDEMKIKEIFNELDRLKKILKGAYDKIISTPSN